MPTIGALPHTAANGLDHFRWHGIPVTTSESPWTLQQKDAAEQRGSHMSASILYWEFFYEEMLDMINKQYWVALPYQAVWHIPQLKITPAGIISHREHWPCPIIDYTWNHLNPTTINKALDHAMQFGHTLQCLLQSITYANPKFGPVHLLMINLTNGYYCIPLSATGVLQLRVILPRKPENFEPLIAFPIICP